MRILVTGAAGFIGSTLVPQLLSEGHVVTAFDRLIWGKEGLKLNFGNSNFRLIEGDIRDEAILGKLVEQAETVVHLAALVGYPLCAKDENQATEINVKGTKSICQHLRNKQLLIYSSTGSIYGPSKGKSCTEDTIPNPQTHYALTKVQAEKALAEKENVVIFRFATAFGYSPRMRLDLLANQFVYEAVKHKALTVYEKDFIRPIIHVADISRSILFAINNRERMQGQIFNVGSTDLMLTKEEIARQIKKQIDFDLQFKDTNSDKDQRNYRLSVEKLYSLGYRPTISLERGVRELIPHVSLLQDNKHCFNA
jgi:nucleoside-diphosphate-sugar epimerase